MSDNTGFRVEAKEFELFGLFSTVTEGEGTDHWKVVGSTYEYDTFHEAIEEAKKQGQIYREIRIVRTVETLMATYKDGVASE